MWIQPPTYISPEESLWGEAHKEWLLIRSREDRPSPSSGDKWQAGMTIVRLHHQPGHQVVPEAYQKAPLPWASSCFEPTSVTIPTVTEIFK